MGAPTKAQTALIVGWALAVTRLSLTFQGNSQWVVFVSVCKHICKTKNMWPAAHRWKLSRTFHSWQLSLLDSCPTYAIGWENVQNLCHFTPVQQPCCCFPPQHSCVNGSVCCPLGDKGELSSRPLLSRVSVVTFRSPVWEPQDTWLEGITNFKQSLSFY